MRSLARATAFTAVLATALPGAARATSLTLGDGLVSRIECVARAATEVTMTWDLGTFTADHLQILASTSSGCADTTTTGITTNALADDLSTSLTGYPSSGDAAITVQDVIDATGVSAGTCDGDDQAVYLCVRAIDSAGATVVNASAKLTLQLEKPPPPVVASVGAGEQALWVSWSAGTAVDGAAATSRTYRVFASANGATVQSAETSGTTLRLGGLANLRTYDVWVVAYSSAGNASDASVASAGTPRHVVDLWEAYQSAGGRETGGCGQGAGGQASLALALGGLLRRRRPAAQPRPRGLPGGGSGQGA